MNRNERTLKKAFGEVRRSWLFPKTLAQATLPVSEKALKRRGFTHKELLLHWGDIVGEELARSCTPVRLSVSRGKGSGGGTLSVKAASSAVALEIQYAEPLILERLTQFYGHAVANRVTILQ